MCTSFVYGASYHSWIPSTLRAGAYRLEIIYTEATGYESLVQSFIDKTSLESVQRRAARWACGSRWSPVQRQWSKSSDVCLQELHWPTLSSRRNYLSVSMMYDILNGRYDSLKFSDYCNFNTSCTRAHSMTLVPPQPTINSYRFSFFVSTVFLWNTVPYAILSLGAPKFRRALYPRII